MTRCWRAMLPLFMSERLRSAARFFGLQVKLLEIDGVDSVVIKELDE